MTDWYDEFICENCEHHIKNNCQGFIQSPHHLTSFCVNYVGHKDPDVKRQSSNIVTGTFQFVPNLPETPVTVPKPLAFNQVFLTEQEQFVVRNITQRVYQACNDFMNKSDSLGLDTFGCGLCPNHDKCCEYCGNNLPSEVLITILKMFGFKEKPNE